MKRISIDQTGEDWVIPIYANETKLLRVFESADGIIAAMAEITPGVYAVGVKK